MLKSKPIKCLSGWSSSSMVSQRLKLSSPVSVDDSQKRPSRLVTKGKAMRCSLKATKLYRSCVQQVLECRRELLPVQPLTQATTGAGQSRLRRPASRVLTGILLLAYVHYNTSSYPPRLGTGVWRRTQHHPPSCHTRPVVSALSWS